jgi:hypothetical protein
MYPDNPNLLEKFAWTKVNEIQNEVQNAKRCTSQPSSKSKLWVMTGLLMALARIFSVIL